MAQTYDNDEVANSIFANLTSLLVRSTKRLVSGTRYSVQHVKIDFGADGEGNEDLVESDNPFPVSTVLGALPSTATHNKTTVGDATAEDALALNASRKKGFLINNTAQTFYVKEGTDAIQGEGFMLTPNRYYEVLTTARVSVIKASGGNLDLDTFEAT